MRYTDVRSRKAVISAINECDRLGRDEFRTHYGFEESRSYYLRHNGKEYDSKPIVAVAHKYQHPDEGPLGNGFSGGKDHAGRQLARLGFAVDGVKVGAQDWTLDEVREVVADYFEMFELTRAADDLNKSARIRLLAKRLPRRNLAAIGRKQSNISAVLHRLELPWVNGLKPSHNTQLLLEAVVFDWIADNPDFFSKAPGTKPAVPAKMTDAEVDAPTHFELKKVSGERRAARVNFAERDEKNRKLGREGEKWALGLLKQELMEIGRTDLAGRVKWVSEEEGDGLGYDIASFDKDGEPLFVEVKTTNGGLAAPFLVTPNEIGASEAVAEFVLMRVFDFGRSARFYRLFGSLNKSCQLEPQLFRALPKA